MLTIDTYLRDHIPSVTACIKVALTFATVSLIAYSVLPLIGY
jgi:hypothetical protein